MLSGCAAIDARRPPTPFQAPHQAAAGDLRIALTGGPVLVDGIEASLPAQAVLDAFCAYGGRFLAHVEGRFAFAIEDRAARCVTLALDRMGLERLAWSSRGGIVQFSTSARNVARELPGGLRLRGQSIFEYLLLHMVPAPQTTYEEVRRLRAGCMVRISDQGAVESRYWVPPFRQTDSEPRDGLRSSLFEALETAVTRCRPDAGTGAFLSGGLDSSTVTGILGRVCGAPPRSFSIGFAADGYDELAYARVAARHFRADAHEYQVTPDDIAEQFHRIAEACDEPFGNSSVVPTLCCAQLALRHGVDHLLAGDGGDELFGGNERYARQRIFEIYGRLPRILRRMLLEPLAGRIDRDSRIVPLRKLRSYVDQARIPMPERLEAWNYMYREDLGAMLAPEFRASIDPRAPLRAMAELWAEAPTTSLLQRMLFFDWQYTLSDNDLRKVGMMCDLAGVRVSYPMLDPAVIDLSLRVPPSMMMEGRELRSFYRRAMRGFLPDEILSKRKHGFGLPFGVWLQSHARLRDLVFGLLTQLRSRRIVREEFIDRLIAGHQAGDAGYHGYAIWDLAMLEAWLTTH